MKNYMDNSFSVAYNTILTYSGQHPILKLPKCFGDIEIKRIGDGAFMESSKLQCVMLPPTVKKIGYHGFGYCAALTSVFVPGELSEIDSQAFSGCPLLSDIIIYDLPLTAGEYHTFKTAGIRSREGMYVLREMPPNKQVQKFVLSVSCAKPACQIPDGIVSLFQILELDEGNGKFSLDKNMSVIGFSVPSVPTTEDKAFCEYIRTAHTEPYFGKAEQKNDWYVRVGKAPIKQKTVIFTFDDTKTREENGTFFIQATLKIGYFFWQSAQPVMYNKKKYYIYRRYYLDSNPEMEYVRREIAVYTEKGLVKNREEAQSVYAKYKLLSIL